MEYIKRTKKKKTQYLDNVKFYEEMKIYHQNVAVAKKQGKEIPTCSNFIGKCFMDIAEHIGQMNSFRNYSFLDEMKGDAVENCLLYCRSFDPEKSSNPFAYFSLTVYRAFLRRIAKEKKELYIKYKAIVNQGIFDDGGLYDESNQTGQFETYDNILEFIETFEKVKENKKLAKPQKIKGVEKFMEE